jgi:hypothetical protein
MINKCGVRTLQGVGFIKHLGDEYDQFSIVSMIPFDSLETIIL